MKSYLAYAGVYWIGVVSSTPVDTVVSTAVDSVVSTAWVVSTVVVMGGCVDVMTGRGSLLQAGTAQGQLQTSILSSKTVPAGHSNM